MNYQFLFFIMSVFCFRLACHAVAMKYYAKVTRLRRYNQKQRIMRFTNVK